MATSSFMMNKSVALIVSLTRVISIKRLKHYVAPLIMSTSQQSKKLEVNVRIDLLISQSSSENNLSMVLNNFPAPVLAP